MGAVAPKFGCRSKMTTGVIRKMVVEATEPVSYWLPMGEERLDVQPLLGSQISLEFTGRIYCIECGRKTTKSFNQGYCFPCLRSLAACDMCIVKPELCHYDQGTCREPAWGESHCMRPHVVYLANSSGLKVGITRASQVPTRWIDQGAVQALPLYEVDSRLQSGWLEVALKRYISDRTDWRAMLKGDPSQLDLLVKRDRLLGEASADLAQCQLKIGSASMRLVEGAQEARFKYPVLVYPEKIKAHNFDKKARVEGCLQGVKGQYMILDTGVLNIRKFAGYEVDLQRD